MNRTLFGRLPSGEPVDLITLKNHDIECEIITFGAALRSLKVRGKNGSPVDVALGYDTLEEYRTRNSYVGAIIGRYANRIAGGRFALSGKEYTLSVNNGANHLHGGKAGFSHRLWTIEEQTDHKAVLSLFSTDGEEGYPGNLTVSVTYQLEENALALYIQASADQETPCSLTQHCYFNLSGHDSGNAMDQMILLHAGYFTPTDNAGIPLGHMEAVDNTPYDLRKLSAIDARIACLREFLPNVRGFDHNYVLDGPHGTLRPSAFAKSPHTGICMAVETDQPGLQFYTASGLSPRAGKNGAQYERSHAFCLEPQFFPDSPNHSNFPSAVLHPGEQYQHTTKYIFTTAP